ncbi:MAG: ABC transporter permease [Actinomycetota bacterium]|nr:ABC transporter permease [Actinomycetota bacterium]
MTPALSSIIAAAAPVLPTYGKGSQCATTNGTFCWDWFTEHWGDTFGPALVQHVIFTAIAVGVGFAIALVFGLLAYRFGWVEVPISLTTGILYTIPSLALFQLLVPITGATRLTVEIALVSYTLLILFRNVLGGLRGVPDDVREAARGMGLTPRQSIVRVELPLALPAIVAGLRVATVTVISLATVAAFIGQPGLGAPIFDAIQRGGFHTEFIGAGVLAIVLALVADALFVLAQRVLTPWASGRTA